ncbi:MAG TPA: T9SS type A sorting domain-containing protein [Flavisolibacter sp.]|jgi:hypothetical protein|nr:T9SS type A sorting domain-containing protein [Flavisolibacter sp.]
MSTAKTKSFLLAVAALLVVHYVVSAQTTLARGDLSIIGWNAGTNPDEIAFVAWVPLAPGTKIRFTDNGWLSNASATAANNARNFEQIATWTNTTGNNIAAGTVIKISLVFPYTASIGTTEVFSNGGGTNPSMALVNTGDQITAYQSTNALASADYSLTNTSPATFNGTVLFALVWPNGWLTSGTAGSGTSYLPAELVGYSFGFTGGSAVVQGGHYTGPKTGMTIAEFKALVNDITNWTVGTTVSLNTTAFTPNATVPVSLLSFTATQQGNGVRINWQTAMEENNAFFILERSSDGRTFSEIKKVAGHGNHTSISRYEVMDQNPVTGTTYYRLKQYDFDGKSKDFGIRAVKYRAAVSGISVSPNPVRARSFSLDMGAPVSAPLPYSIIDLKGQVLQSGMITGQTQRIELANSITRGQYILQVNNRQTVKLQVL